jgi:ABC-2 type transport system ATP-binding protein
VLSAGRIVASGTPAELKARVGRLSATVSLASHSDAPRATRALEGAGLIPVHDEARGALVTPVDASGELAFVVRALDGAGVEAAGLALAEPTLEDVYLALACPDPSTAA